MSGNGPNTGLRVFHSIRQYASDVTQVALTGGESSYFCAFRSDLLLWREESEVQAAIDDGDCDGIAVSTPTGSNS
jgi:5'-nucleotidase